MPIDVLQEKDIVLCSLVVILWFVCSLVTGREKSGIMDNISSSTCSNIGFSWQLECILLLSSMLLSSDLGLRILLSDFNGSFHLIPLFKNCTETDKYVIWYKHPNKTVLILFSYVASDCCLTASGQFLSYINKK
jgi:hypothetical protein